MPFAIWVTGLPGSGKSAISGELIKILKKEKVKFKYLRLDEIRKKIVKNPKYTNKERDFVYKKFADIGVNCIKKNKNVIFDATAHKKKYRERARKKIKNFAEAYIKCPISICVKRESKREQGLVIADIYKKALQRKRAGKKYKNLGKVIGVDVMFEESKKSEIKINSGKTKPKKAANIIFNDLKKNNFL